MKPPLPQKLKEYITITQVGELDRDRPEGTLNVVPSAWSAFRFLTPFRNPDPSRRSVNHSSRKPFLISSFFLFPHFLGLFQKSILKNTSGVLCNRRSVSCWFSLWWSPPRSHRTEGGETSFSVTVPIHHQH